MQQRTVGINVQDSLAVGHIQITLTHWTDALEPEVSAGSVLEIGGSTFYALANDDLDGAGAWGGIANSTLVYIYYSVSGTTATAALSTTAPTWSVTKQGWYNVAETQRCIGSIYKDAGGTYTQKTLFLSREHAITYQGVNLGGNSANADRVIRIASDASILWDESENAFIVDKEWRTTSWLKSAYGIKVAGTVSINNVPTTQNALYLYFITYVPTVGDEILVSGSLYITALSQTVHLRSIRRKDANTITLYGLYGEVAGSGIYAYDCVNGSATVALNFMSIAW